VIISHYIQFFTYPFCPINARLTSTTAAAESSHDRLQLRTVKQRPGRSWCPIAHECRRIPNGYETLLFQIPNVSPTSVMAEEIYQIFLFRESLTHFKDAFSPPTSSVASGTTQGYLTALSSFCKEQTLDKSGSAFELRVVFGYDWSHRRRDLTSAAYLAEEWKRFTPSEHPTEWMDPSCENFTAFPLSSTPCQAEL